MMADAPQKEFFSAEPAPDLQRPQRIGRYCICSRLAEGGFSTVYLAFDKQEDRPVALKVALPGRIDSDDWVVRFLREARNVERLDHPSIVRAYDAGQADGYYYITFEYIEGTDLKQLAAKRRFAPTEAARIVAQVAETMHFAHSRGVIHRDIKPSNILLDLCGRLHVTDFGLAASVGDLLGAPNHWFGTPHYIAPELLDQVSSQADPRADIYSLGIVLYELLCGMRPFEGDSIPNLFEKIRHAEPILPTSLNGAIPPELERICLRAMARQSGDRYATAAELAMDLKLHVADVDEARSEPAEPDSHGRLVGDHSGVLLPTPVLRIVSNHGEKIERVFEVNQARVLIGRSPEHCHIVLDPNGVSRRHAEISHKDGSYFLSDLNTRNRTQLNRQWIKPGNPYAIKHGDIITICECDLFFETRMRPANALDKGDVLVISDDSSVLSGAAHSVVLEEGASGGNPLVKFRAVLEIARNLSRELEIDALAPKILDSLMEIFPQAERLFLVLVEPATKLLVRKAFRCRPGRRANFTSSVPADEAQLSISRSIVNHVLVQKKAVLSQDASMDKNLPTSASIADLKIRSVMCVPLITPDGQATGILQLDTSDRKQFHNDDLDVLLAVAGQAAIAIENARLHELTLDQQRRLSTEQRALALTTVHNLRQPLTVMRGALMRASKLLSTEAVETLPARDAVGDALGSLRRCEDTVAGFLRFIKPPELKKAPVDLAKVVQETAVWSSLAHELVQFDVGDLEDAMVLGDREALRQVFEQLLSNAVREMKEVGTIRIFSQHQSTDEGSREDVHIMVEDDGPGVAPELFRTLFEPFTTTGTAGMGLGLAFAKAIIRQHRGEIWHEPVEPHGARFVIQLPLHAN